MTLPLRGAYIILLEHKSRRIFLCAKEYIKVQGLTKSFQGRTVVDHLSFSVGKGEVFGLVGHNGAGKSTTIDMILGLKKPDAGLATIWEMDALKNRKKIFEKVGVQFQSSSYQAAIRVEEVCREYAAFYRKPADYRELLEQFDLAPLANSPVMKLSGGERQKLSVVLALMGNPDVENLCDRILLLRKGKKIIEGTVGEVIKASPYDNLEEAYLWFMGEEAE